jgi:hypothetical protein
MLRETLAESRAALERALAAREARPRVRETGVVLRAGGGIARVRGLPGLGAEELVDCPAGCWAWPSISNRARPASCCSARAVTSSPAPRRGAGRWSAPRRRSWTARR